MPAIISEVLADVRPSAHVERLQFMDLLAVQECTDTRFLPERFAKLSLSEVNRRIEAAEGGDRGVGRPRDQPHGSLTFWKAVTMDESDFLEQLLALLRDARSTIAWSVVRRSTPTSSPSSAWTSTWRLPRASWGNWSGLWPCPFVSSDSRTG